MSFLSPKLSGLSMVSEDPREEPADIKPWDHWYGYVVSVSVLLVQFGIFGTMTGYSTFSNDMHKDPSLGHPSKTMLSLPIAIANGLSPFLAIFVGALCDHIGPRITLGACAICSALGLVLASFAPSATLLIVFYAVPSCIAAAGAAAPAASTVAYWFKQKLALGMGIATGGNGAASIILMPIIGAMAGSSLGWRNSFRLLAIVPIALAFGPSLLIKRREKVHPKGVFNRGDLLFAKELLSHRVFWLLFSLGIFFGYAFFGVLYFTVPFAMSWGKDSGPYQEYEAMSDTLAGSLMTFFGVGNWVGSVSLGALATRTEPRMVFVLSSGLLATACLFWPLCTGFTELGVVAGISGFAISGAYSTIPSMAGRCFAGPRTGIAVGCVMSSYGFGGLLAPIVGNAIADASGEDMTLAFLTMSISSTVSGLIALIGLYHRIRHRGFATKSFGPEDAGEDEEGDVRVPAVQVVEQEHRSLRRDPLQPRSILKQ